MKKQSDLACDIAIRAHAGQFRRDGFTPYIDHPRAVVRWLIGRNEPDEVLAVGWLHDVLEDTDETISSLQDAGVSKLILEAVFLLSKNLSGFDRNDYFNRIKKNAMARKAKIADMICNLADQPTDEQIKRYVGALKFLTE